MPPQQQTPNFEFMMNNNQPAKHGLPLSGIQIPRWAKIVLAFIALIVLLMVYSSISSRGSRATTAAMAGVLARNKETLRITSYVQQQLQLQDTQVNDLAATVTNSLTSDQAQLKQYLTNNHIHISTAQQAADTDKTTDTAMQTAQQNNNLDAAYVAYLKDALAKYEQDLRNAYQLAGPNGKQLLSTSFQSAQVLLGNPPFKS